MKRQIPNPKSQIPNQEIPNPKSEIPNLSGIYIHIPFCSKRCNYCDFYLITNLDLINRFLINLKKEISLYSDSFRESKFDTIFFGGGTPSLLKDFQIADLIDHLNKYFSISSDTEISIEANPEDFLHRSIKDYTTAGINRISFGVQSFIDEELKFLTRQHTSKEAENVIIEALKQLDNINLDVIYSLPSQSIENIDYSLSKAIELGVNHISAYTLTYEEKTVLFKSIQNNSIKKNPDSKEAELYNFVSEKLISNGYEHYEVSNFAKENFKCRHNLKYWNYENYLGLGPSSHSFFNNTRWNNIRSLGRYNSDLENNILPVEEKYELIKDQKKLEYIMLSLRSSGIDFKKYSNIINEDFSEVFSDSINELVINNYAETDVNGFRLNERGYTLADEIIAKYF